MKNLTVYRSPAGWLPDLPKLSNNLSEPGKIGYSWKVLRNDLPFISVGKNILLVCEKQEKLLPASVINRELKIRAKKLTELQGYRIGKKQMRDLKEQITAELFAKAFTTFKPVNVWIDQKNDLLCIETTSDSVADDVYLKLCRDIDYRGHRIIPARHVESFMRELLVAEDQSIDGFYIGRNCALQSIDEKSKTITYKNEFLRTEEVKNYVLQGKRPTKLEIQYENECTFTIDNRFVISKVTLPDLVEKRGEFDTDDDYFDNEFTIRSGQISKAIKTLLNVLGEQESIENSEAA